MRYNKTHLSIRETPKEQRPRERMQAQGALGLSDQELLSIIIGSGTKSMPVHEISTSLMELIDKHGPQVTLEELSSVKGLGHAKSSLIAAVIEFGRRRFHNSRQRIAFPSDAYPLIRHLADRPQEHFLCIRLNGAHEVMGINIVSIGLVNRTIVHPRDVLTSHLIQSYWGKKG